MNNLRRLPNTEIEEPNKFIEEGLKSGEFVHGIVYEDGTFGAPYTIEVEKEYLERIKSVKNSVKPEDWPLVPLKFDDM
jgi:hypothetical protein